MRHLSLRALLLAFAAVLASSSAFAQCTYSNITTSTFASTFSSAAGGSTICLTAGNYGSFSGGSKSSTVTIQPDAANGGTQSNVSFGALNFDPASYITMHNVTIAGGTLGDSSTPATHIHLTNIIFTDAVCINTPTDANIDILIDSSTFNNIGQSCTEGRLGITGQNNSNTWTTPNGVQISNSTFSGSGAAVPSNCSDGININGGGYGTMIGPGNTFINIQESSCTAHVDSIQFYGAHDTTITGNFFYNDSDGIMSPDCNGSPMTVTNNVFVQDPSSATNEVIVAGGNGDTFNHNTFGSTHSNPRFGNPNSCGLNTNITLTNNIFMGGIDLTDGQSASTFTENHNLIPGGGSGTGTINGSPTFVGGSSPTTLAGFQLTSGSLGYHSASDGGNIGIPASGGGSGTVTITSGQDVAAIINSAGSGTTFTIQAGTYRLTAPIVPKANDTINGNSGAILSGAKLLTSWSTSGSYWVTGTPVLQSVSASRTCNTSTPLCNWPDDVYFDNTRLAPVSSLGQLSSGGVYIDRTNNLIYIASNPSGHTVEQNWIAEAIEAPSSASTVSISGLTIEKFATPTSGDAVAGRQGWSITNCEIRFNHAWGVDGFSTVLGNFIHHNGQMGTGAYGLASGNYSNNEISFNNAAGYNPQSSDGEAGGTKWLRSTNVMIDSNYVHDNAGPGLWLDTDNKYITISNNHTQNNLNSGIAWEISFDGTIKNNLIENDDTQGHPGSAYYGFSIDLNDSQNVEIYGNTIINSVNGIGGTASNRGTSSTYGVPYVLKNDYVHNNTITMQSGMLAAGYVSSYSNGDIFSSAYGNSFVNNTYCLPSLTANMYAWGGSNVNKAGWQADGQDTGGTWSCSGTPAPPTISSFTATPATVTSGSPSTLAWSVSGATSLSISGIGTVTGTSTTVNPTATTTYTLTATNSGGSTTAAVTITVSTGGGGGGSGSPPTISSFTATPSAITTGQLANLLWSVSGATSLSINNGVGTVTGSNVSVTPSATTTYTLTATNSSGASTAQATITVSAPGGSAPTISSFTASPTSVALGTSTTLSWTTSSASSISIDNFVGPQTGTSVAVTPSVTTTYTITATNQYGSTTATVTVTVTQSGTFGIDATQIKAVDRLGTTNGVRVQMSDGTYTSGHVPKQTSDGTLTDGGALPAWTEETPGGTVNGSNTTFTLSATPISGSLTLYLGTSVALEGTDFTVSGATITFATAPASGTTRFQARYQH